jgi:ADP-ribose pyrophosphatase
MNKRILHTGKWLSFGENDVTTPSGKALKWEFTTRTGTTDGAVCMIALKKRTNPTSIVLVKQFRPPIEAEILELPAGLVEAGQNP